MAAWVTACASWMSVDYSMCVRVPTWVPVCVSWDACVGYGMMVYVRV